jgi:hypothetical protein
MLFRLCEHYENNFPIYKQDISNECFICFEYKNDNGILPIYLTSQNLYLNECVCNGSVHIECLKIWFNKNKKCPICRIRVIENNNTTIIIYNYIPFGITIYTYTKKIIIAVIRVFSCMLVLFLIIDFYFMIANTKYREYNYREYNDVEHNDYTYTISPILDKEYIE